MASPYGRLRDYGAVALLKTLCAWEGKKSEDSDAVFIRNLLHNNTGGMRLAIAQREWHHLELLDLSNNGIEEVGGVVVAAIICLGPKLLQCNLDWNSIRGRGALALGQALNNVPQSLRALSLDHNPLGDIGAAAIADALVCVLCVGVVVVEKLMALQVQRGAALSVLAILRYRRCGRCPARLRHPTKPDPRALERRAQCAGHDRRSQFAARQEIENGVAA